MMDLLISLVVVVVGLATASAVLWGLGWWSRKSTIGKALSYFVIAVFVIIMASAYFVRFDVGSITMSVDRGSVKEITGINISIDARLDKYVSRNKVLIVTDDKSNTYYAAIPANMTTISHEAKLHPAKSLISFQFLVVKLGDLLLVVTWGKIFALIMSSLAVFVVWAAGNEGQLAFLVPGGDD